jgi:hypothetical protein
MRGSPTVTFLARRRVALIAILGVTGVAVGAPTAAWAVFPRDGFGFGVADDSYLSPGAQIPGDFSILGPKTFRLQVHWNAVRVPGEIENARSWIAQARAHGAQQIVVTFKENDDAPCEEPPSVSCYSQAIAPAIQALANDVDVWGPANEPNLGDAWLPNVAGAQRLAQYWAVFNFILASPNGDPTAKRLSPEFQDRSDLGSIATYVNAYKQAGGGFGDYAGFHPYWGLHSTTAVTVSDLLEFLPPTTPVWITEVGAFGKKPAHTGSPAINDSEADQARRVNWLLNDPHGLAQHPRVARINYYHLRASADPNAWDTGLSRADGSPRPAWFMWCAATHQNNASPVPCNVPLFGWFDWQGLGGGLAASAPAALTRGPGRIDVFARGVDNKLWRWWVDGAQSGWQDLGGGIASTPSAVSWSANRLDVFAQGVDNKLWRWWTDGVQSGWQLLGGGIASAPEAISRGPGRIDVFAQGTDNGLWRWWVDGAPSGWEAWGGGIAAKPSVVSWGPTHLDVYAQGPDNGLWHRAFDGGVLGPWRDLGHGLASAPAVTSWSANRIDAFVRGQDNGLGAQGLYRRTYDGN